MVVSLGQIGLAVTILVVFGIVWYLEGRGRWRARLEQRLILGVPWGTLVTIGVVVAFYLFVQGGFRNWSEPLTFPFITWSYFYPFGQLTAGVAHQEPLHLASNMTATLVFAPIAEYVWGHYPPKRSRRGSRTRASGSGGVLTRPWVRALLVVPAAFLGVAVLTALFAMGPGLGFSGAVFAIVGFALVGAPLWTIGGALAVGTVSALVSAFANPVVEATVEAGPPMPPAWAGVGFQAHLLGFLVGAVVALGLLRYRNETPAFVPLFFATILVGIAFDLSLIASGTTDVFVRYQAAGVVLVFVLATLVAFGASASDRPLFGAYIEQGSGWGRRLVAIGWLGILGLCFLGGLTGALLLEVSLLPVLVGVGMVSLLLAVPALAPALRPPNGPLSRRQTAAAIIIVLAVLVAFPSVPGNMLVVEDADLGSGVEETAEINGYTVAYGENVTAGQSPAIGTETFEDELGDEANLTASGVVVVDPDREMWTLGTTDDLLAFSGNESVVVGDIGWRETVTADRTGWEVAGNDTAYAVDIEADEETTRTFISDPVTAAGTLEGQTVSVEPTLEEFLLEVREDGSTVGETPIPETNESATAGDIEFRTEETDDGSAVFAASGGSELQIATEETFNDG